jgi:hypothetical protein
MPEDREALCHNSFGEEVEMDSSPAYFMIDVMDIKTH